jgi:hypothetical protein
MPIDSLMQPGAFESGAIAAMSEAKPSTWGSHLLRSGMLRRVLTGWEAPLSTIYAVYPGNGLMSMKGAHVRRPPCPTL